MKTIVINNFGVFMMKRTDWTIEFLGKIYQGILVERDLNAEQTYTRRLMERERSIQSKIHWARQKQMNAFWMNQCGDQWAEGDWILHQVNCHRAACNSAFIQMSLRVSSSFTPINGD